MKKKYFVLTIVCLTAAMSMQVFALNPQPEPPKVLFGLDYIYNMIAFFR